MNATVYVNTPLEPEEHDALAAMAKAEGRSKGQQLRHLLLKVLPLNSTPTPSRKRKEARK